MNRRNLGMALDTIEKLMKQDPSIQQKQQQPRPPKQQQQQQQERLATLDNANIAPYQYVLEQLWPLLQPSLSHMDSRLLCRILCVASQVQCTDSELYAMCLQAYLSGTIVEYGPRNVSNVVHAICTAGDELKEPLLPIVKEQLLPGFMQQLPAANAQDISNVLYGLALCGQVLGEAIVQQQVVRLLAVVHEAKVQTIANALWAVATMEANLRVDQLQQLVGALCKQLSWAKALDVSHTLWACATLMYLPAELLSAPKAVGLIATAGTQELSNIAWACGELGFASEQWMLAIVHRTRQLVDSGSKDVHGVCLSAQHRCNIAWALAVLNMQRHANTVLLLVMVCSQEWSGNIAVEEMRQLWQVHNRLLCCPQISNGQGLRGTLTTEQLLQCKADWDAHFAAVAKSLVATHLQHSVFDAVTKLRIDWLQPPRISSAVGTGCC